AYRPNEVPIGPRIVPLDVGQARRHDGIEHAVEKCRRRDQPAMSRFRSIIGIAVEGVVVAEPPGIVADDVTGRLAVPALDTYVLVDQGSRLFERVVRKARSPQFDIHRMLSCRVDWHTGNPRSMCRTGFPNGKHEIGFWIAVVPNLLGRREQAGVAGGDADDGPNLAPRFTHRMRCSCRTSVRPGSPAFRPGVPGWRRTGNGRWAGKAASGRETSPALPAGGPGCWPGPARSR